MHVDEVLWHGDDAGTAGETLHRCCVMTKVIRKEVAAGGRFEFFLGAGKNRYIVINLILSMLLVFH